MRVYSLSLVAIVAIGALLSGCGGASSVIPQDPANPGGYNLTIPTGPGMPQAVGDDVQLDPTGRIVSNVYRKFMADAVNEHSFGRWHALNASGQKQWTLSNTYNSAPKAFLFGGNYWNHESDFLFSNNFTVPDQTDGVRVTFTARWKIAEGDSASVIYNTPAGPQLIAEYQGGQNPDYPGWTKYYYELPANFSGDADSNTLEFYFASDATMTDFGFAFDDVAVYQRQLEPLTDVSATDGDFSITVTWTPNNAGTLAPDSYDVYRSTVSGSGYTLQESVPYPGTIWNDTTASPNVTYYYVVKCTKPGWPDSVYSNEDSGFYTFGQ